MKKWILSLVLILLPTMVFAADKIPLAKDMKVYATQHVERKFQKELEDWRTWLAEHIQNRAELGYLSASFTHWPLYANERVVDVVKKELEEKGYHIDTTTKLSGDVGQIQKVITWTVRWD